MSTTCPHCGKVNDMADGVFDRTQHIFKDGDVSLCIGCGKVAIFDSSKEAGVRLPTLEESNKLGKDYKLSMVLLAWELMNRESKMT